MCVFTRYGFFSAACVRQGSGKRGPSVDTNRFMVRARVCAHLESLKQRYADLLGQCEIQEFARTDHVFRVSLRSG